MIIKMFHLVWYMSILMFPFKDLKVWCWIVELVEWLKMQNVFGFCIVPLSCFSCFTSCYYLISVMHRGTNNQIYLTCLALYHLISFFRSLIIYIKISISYNRIIRWGLHLLIYYELFYLWSTWNFHTSPTLRLPTRTWDYILWVIR